MHPRKLVSCVYVFVLLAVAALGASVQAAPEPVDPIVGNWVWHDHKIVVFKADGTVKHLHGTEGTWQYLKNSEVQRHYRIVWEHGVYIDETVCSEDGQRAHIRSKDGKYFEARRAIDDPPAASPTPASSAAKPTGITPGKSLAVAQPTVADAVDPIVGEWNWLKGQAVTFLADGTVKAANGGHGTWELLPNPEAERKYRVTWSPGTYVCDVVYNPVTQTGRATNTKGRMFDVTRKTATPGQPGSYFGTQKP